MNDVISLSTLHPPLAFPEVRKRQYRQALCETMSWPTMRSVPIKISEQQAALMLVDLREWSIRNRRAVPVIAAGTMVPKPL